MVADMQKPGWFDGKINLGNIVSWAVMVLGITASYIWMQADVKALQTFRDEAKTDIKEIKRDRQIDRDTLLDMKGDVRVIRQIVEGASRK